MTRSTRLLCNLACACTCLAASACSRDDAPAPPPGSPSRATATAATEPAAVDAQDDRQAPRALPDTGDLAGWIKTEPIRQVKIDQLPMWVNDAAVAKALSTFPIDRIWTCVYTSHTGHADIAFLEVSDPLDAFGLFSVLTHQPGLVVRPEDGTMLESQSGKGVVRVTGWQGKVCLLVWASGFSDRERQPSAEQLARRILFSIPAGDPPLITQAIPRTMLADGKVWMVRRAAALAITFDELKRVAAADLDSVLGLTGREKLWLAAVGKRPETQASESKPADHVSMKHLLWIAEYTNESDARMAFDRYRQRLASHTTDLDRETRVCEPRGPYLVGTWTAGAETADPLLPALLERLPIAADKPANRSIGRSVTRPTSVPQ